MTPAQVEDPQPSSGSLQEQWPCPGSCNAAWRKAQARADLVAAAAVAADRALTERERLVVDHGIAPWLGDPRWCRPCGEQIRSAIGRMPDLAAALLTVGHDEPVCRLRVVVDRALVKEVPIVALVQGEEVVVGQRRWWRETLACGHTLHAEWTRGLAPFVRTCSQCILATGVGQ